MSDRKLVVEQSTGARKGSVKLFMDGDSGTWRLFTFEDDQIGGENDFTLEALRLFAANLQRVLHDIDAQPDDFNAEVRKTWD